MATIRVVGLETVIRAEMGASVLESLTQAGVPVSSSCGARAACGLCRVTVLRGAEMLSPLVAEEINHLGSVAKIVGMRLACQAKVMADGELEIEVPVVVDVAARKRDKARKHALARASSPHHSRGSSERTMPAPQRSSEPGNGAAEQVEWRPRKLSSK